MRRRKTIILGAAMSLLLLTTVGASGEDFTSPLFGLDTAPNGDIVVADAGAGIHVMKDGAIESTIQLPLATDASPIGVGSMWVTTTGTDPEADTGQALWRISKGSKTMVANLFAFEDAEDPDDPSDGKHSDSNPFDVQSLGGSAALVADAGGNDLLRIDRRGNIEVLAVFPSEPVSTANAKALFGCPAGPPEICAAPDQVPAEAVPTSIAIGEDGWYYVGELKGFPAPTGESNIWRVSPDATGELCPNVHCELVFDGGFTSIIDLAFDGEGNLLVAELDEASWAAVEITGVPTGGTVNSCDVSSLNCEVLHAGIPILTAITVGKDGTLWATENALIPGLADVVALD